MTELDEHFRWMHRFRGVHTPCETCRGFGACMYASTSTWRGGMGGALMTQDVCDKCWGSGDAHDHWTDLRKLRAEEDSRVATRAASFLSDRCGFGMTVLNAGLEELATELDKFERQRRKRPYGFDTVARTLAQAVRDMVEASKKANAR